MSVAAKVFRWSMLGAALILAGVSIYFLFAFSGAAIEIAGSGLAPFFQQFVRAMWLGFCLQLGVMAAVFLYASLRPQSVGRNMVLMLSLMPILSTVLLVLFAASRMAAVFLGLAGALVLLATFLWPRRVLVQDAPPTGDIT